MLRVLLLSNPRSGSSFLKDLLNCHSDVEIADELLNDEFGLIANPMETIKSRLDGLHKTIVGFKVFPQQIFTHELTFADLLTETATSHVIILWRENMLETFCSQRIANLNGEWYTMRKNNKTVKILIDDSEDLK